MNTFHAAPWGFPCEAWPPLVSQTVQHLRLFWFAKPGVALEAIRSDLDDSEASLERLRAAQNYLWWIVQERPELQLALEASRENLSQLFHEIHAVIGAPVEERASKLEVRKAAIYASVDRLLPGLEADVNKEPAFLILQKRAYNTRTLILDGSKFLSAEVRDSLTEDERYDIRQAAKCLAFEVPTASAFHLFRAMEGVLRRYYALVVKGSKPKKQPRNWDSYIQLMKKYGKPNERVIFMLDQVRWLYRNPIMHPDEHISQEAAESLFGLADTVIRQLSTEIKDLSLPSPAVAELPRPAALPRALANAPTSVVPAD